MSAVHPLPLPTSPCAPGDDVVPCRFERRYAAGSTDARGESLPAAAVLVERADLDRRACDERLAEMLEHEAAEGWNPRAYDYVAWLWETPVPSGQPIGFATLAVTFDRAARGRHAYAAVAVGLVWIHPARRRRKLGTRLAAAIGDWLQACRAYGPRFAPGGLAVDVLAELYSEGGNALTRQVLEHFVRMQRAWAAGTPAAELGWAVREARDRREWHWPLP